MIKDKTSPGYKIAEKCVSIFKNDGEKATAEYFNEQCKNQPMWVALAIKDTFQQLLKEVN